MHRIFWLLVCLFCFSAFTRVDLDPQPLLGNYHRDYTWGRIVSYDGKLCLTEENHQVFFKECKPGPTKDNVTAFPKQLANREYYSQYWIYVNEHLRSLAHDGQVSNTCIDLPSEKKGAIGTPVKTKGCNDTVYQSFKLVHVKGSGDDALFMFRPRDPQAKNRCLDMDDGNKPVYIWSCDENNTNQIFKLQPSFAQLYGSAPTGYDAFPDGALKEYGLDPANWMSQLYSAHEDVALKDIMIPGTHDSATFTEFSALSTTQELSILQQLEAGIRYVDLRLGKNGKIVHGIEQGPAGSIERAIKEIASFAQQHPKEIIFVDIHELPTTPKDLTAISQLIKDNLLDRLQPSNIELPDDRWIGLKVSEVTFRFLWAANKNIILLVRNYVRFWDYFPFNNMWDKTLGVEYNNNISNNINWEEVWPNATNFGLIYKRNSNGLTYRNRDKWHMSQLIRTPQSIFIGVKKLDLQQTNDGNFNFIISKWMYNWAAIYGWFPNFLSTDFFNKSQIVAMALWLNKKKLLSIR